MIKYFPSAVVWAILFVFLINANPITAFAHTIDVAPDVLLLDTSLNNHLDLSQPQFGEGGNFLRTPTDTATIIVQFTAVSSTAERTALLQEYGAEIIETDLLPHTYLVSVDSDMEVEALDADDIVVYAESDHLYQSTQDTPTLIPDDTFYSEQWGLEKINAPEAWATTTGSSDVIVAVIDTGIDRDHPDLEGQLTNGAIASRFSQTILDGAGHGTHVASIIAASSDNQQGTAGVAWGARIMPIKALGSGGFGNLSDIIRGFRWAVDNGADIINMSLGGGNSSRTFQSAVDYANEWDVLVVAAAGNEFRAGSPVNYPAAYEGVLAVAATDQDDEPANFSNRGDYIDIAAPGVGILAATSRFIGANYIRFDGTSMAAPFVSGVAALLLSIDPDLSSQELMDLITETAVDIGLEGKDDRTGYGRIDAAAAVEALSNRATAQMLYLPIIMGN